MSQSPARGLRTLVEVESIFGRIEAFADDLITDQIVAFGAHTRPEIAFLLSVVDEGDRVFDLGGHIGSFAIPLAKKVGPRGSIVVVEGLPETFAVLERNLKRSAGAARTIAINALIAKPGVSYEASTPQGNTGASFFRPTADAGTAGIPTASLEALCHTYFFPRVVKIDLEGFEAFALSSAPALLARRPIVYAEVADLLLRRAGATVDQLDGLLSANGYRYFHNIGDRNAAHDDFAVAELPSLCAGGEFFDVLAVHRDDERLSRLIAKS